VSLQQQRAAPAVPRIPCAPNRFRLGPWPWQTRGAVLHLLAPPAPHSGQSAPEPPPYGCPRTASARATALILVRHGHVVDNDAGGHARLCGWADPPLSPLGRWQARQLAERLRAEPVIAALYASPLRRAKQTAGAVAGALGLRPRLRPGLQEIGCGTIDGWRLAEVKHRYPDLWAANLAQDDEAFRWPGGESYRTFRARALRIVRRIAAAHPGERVVIVTHSGLITQIVGALAGSSAARWEAFRTGNASVTEIHWRGDNGVLVRFDDRRHL
jgi:broad specificity phosphatase PhoE